MWLASPRSDRRDGPVPLDLPSRCSRAREVHLNSKPQPNCGATISQAGSEFKSKVEGKLAGGRTYCHNDHLNKTRAIREIREGLRTPSPPSVSGLLRRRAGLV